MKVFSTLLKINRPIINIRDVLKIEVLIKEKLNIVFLNTKYLRHSITDVIGLSITMLLYFSGTELSGYITVEAYSKSCVPKIY